KLRCLESTSSGDLTSTKTATFQVNFTGCELLPSKEQCTTAGASAGEIKTGTLNGELGFLKDVVVKGVPNITVGWDFQNGGSILTAQCGPSKIGVNVTGSVIGAVTANKMLTTYGIKFLQKAGKQNPESFEEEPKQTLSETFGSVPAEQVGLANTTKVFN